MTPSTQEIVWRSAGWLGGQPAETAWTILGAAAILGLFFVIVSYCYTLLAVAPWRRAILCLLRFVLWLMLLLILAGPTRVERIYDRPPAGRPLAVLVDRSDSMTAADNRQHRRLDDAFLKWHRMEPDARQTFGAVKAFAFAQGLTPISTPAAMPTTALPGGRTDFYASLHDVLAQAPPGGWGGIVTLTDGLDTSGVESSEALRATVRTALVNDTPLFFVVGRNRATEPPFFRIREFNVPAQIQPRSIFRIEAVFESYQTSVSTLAVQFEVNSVAKSAEPLRLEAGRHLETWSADVPAREPGTIGLDLRAGTELARAEVRVVRPPSNRILYFEGALDWGYRFLADILKRDGDFRLTPVFDFPNAGIVLPPGARARMPASPTELEPFDIVVLANASANEFSSGQEAALTQWVDHGGILLFLTPDDDSAHGFAGSELEKMLPVVFMTSPPAGSAPDAPPKNNFFHSFDLTRIDNPSPPTALTAFAWERTPRVREIFGQTQDGVPEVETPLFSTYAHVERAKAGAEILARHPGETGPGGKGAILLAVQRYGRGKSVVFTTDALWRWKLNQPSVERGAEIFWEDLFSWLGRGRDHGFYFDHPPAKVPIEEEVTLHIVGAGSQPLRVQGRLGGQRVPLTELTPDATSRVFRWRPPTAGFWQIEATANDGEEAKDWLSVEKPPKPGELSGNAPDEELLRALAAQTGGAVLEDVPSAWGRHPAPKQLLSERRQPLWHRPWVFGAILGLYGLEMLLRRKWKLL